MQKVTALALVVGALIVAAALLHHGRQLAHLSSQLGSLQTQNARLEVSLQELSTGLPTIIEEASRNAGRQAVRGAFEEVIEKPLRRLNVAPTASTNILDQIVSQAEGIITNRGASVVRFDISQPVVNIEFFGNLRRLPDGAWLPRAEDSKQIAPAHKTARRTDPSESAGPE